ncbi:MAG: hypothetical protein SynsKO_30660 [Synoicihabitans sp.]
MKITPLCARTLAILALLVAMTGCETTAPKAKAPPPEAFTIKRGDPVATLIAQMGEPDQKSTISKDGSSGEVWTYRHKMRSKVRMVPAGTREVPIYDRNTEQTVMVSEPVFTQEFSRLDQITEFLIMKGSVISWKQRIDKDSTRIE